MLLEQVIEISKLLVVSQKNVFMPELLKTFSFGHKTHTRAGTVSKQKWNSVERIPPPKPKSTL